MTLSIQDYVGRVRDSRWENELARSLRSRAEADRLAFIMELIGVNLLAALTVARGSLSENPSFLILLDRGLDEADPTVMRYWLECVVPRLGFKKVLAHLERAVASNPRGVARARYWLPLFAKQPGYSQERIDALNAVRS